MPREIPPPGNAPKLGFFTSAIYGAKYLIILNPPLFRLAVKKKKKKKCLLSDSDYNRGFELNTTQNTLNTTRPEGERGGGSGVGGGGHIVGIIVHIDSLEQV